MDEIGVHVARSAGDDERGREVELAADAHDVAIDASVRQGGGQVGVGLRDHLDMVTEALYELGLHAEPDQGDRFDRDSVIWVTWED